jgi:hypothetical protein
LLNNISRDIVESIYVLAMLKSWKILDIYIIFGSEIVHAAAVEDERCPQHGVI